MRHPRARLVALALLLAACAGPDASVSTPPSAVPTTDDAAAREIRSLANRIAGEHPDPWAFVSESEFEAATAALAGRIEELAPEARITEVMRLMALIGGGGRNGHMLALPAGDPWDDRLPLTFHRFADGLFITSAQEPHRDLVGAEVVGVGGRTLQRAQEALEPLMSRDNAHTDAWQLPLFLAHPAVLHGAGIGDDSRTVMLDLRLPDGSETRVNVAAVATEAFDSLLEAFVWLRPPADPDVLWLSDQATELWLRHLPEANAVYVQYNTIWEPTGGYLAQIRAALERGDASSTLVLDLRHNPGGENHNYAPLLDGLAQMDADGRRLVVLIGRATFSAATFLAAELQQRTGATFVGDPTGGSPTTYAGVDTVHLDEIGPGMVAFLPDQASSVGPPGVETVLPDFEVAVTSEDFFAGRDPVLDAALAAAAVPDAG